MRRRKPRQLLYQTPSKIVERLKQLAEINTPNADMSDDQIKTLMRVVAVSIPGSIAIDANLSTSRVGVEMMLNLTLMVFPKYYERCGLSQFN